MGAQVANVNNERMDAQLLRGTVHRTGCHCEGVRKVEEPVKGSGVPHLQVIRAVPGI